MKQSLLILSKKTSREIAIFICKRYNKANLGMEEKKSDVSSAILYLMQGLTSYLHQGRIWR